MAGTDIKRAAPRVHGGKGSKQRLAEGERMLADHTTGGMRISELVEKYGVSHATISRRLAAAIDARLAPTVDRYRAEQNVLLDEQLRELTRQLDAGTLLISRATTTDPDTGLEVVDTELVERGLAVRQRAIEARIRVTERRARLNGLDAPVKAEVSMTVETVQERELRDLLAQAEREQAVRESQLVDEEDVTA